jgi:hypothetical protein
MKVYKSNYVILFIVPFLVLVELFHLNREISFLYFNNAGRMPLNLTLFLSAVYIIVVIWCSIKSIWCQSLLNFYEKHCMNIQYQLEQLST